MGMLKVPPQSPGFCPRPRLITAETTALPTASPASSPGESSVLMCMVQAAGAWGIKGFWQYPSAYDYWELVNKCPSALTKWLGGSQPRCPLWLTCLGGNTPFIRPPFPYGSSWHHLPNKTLALKSWSQGLFLGGPNPGP